MAHARLVGWITLFACLAPRGAAAAPPEAPQGHVLLITIDGLSASLLDDPASSLPTLRALAKQGAVAEGIRPSNPTVTWPNHTTLITGVRADKHSLFFNGVLERPGVGKPVRINMLADRAELIAVPTLFEVAKAKRLRTAAINWPCTRGATSVDDNFPDVPGQVEIMTPSLRERLIAEGQLPAGATTNAFRGMGMVRRDEVWTAAMARVIADSKPALMTFHLLTVDAIHHANGPASAPGYAAMALADSNVAKVLAALDAAGIRETTTVIVTADHGFATAKKLILPNVAFRKAKLLTAGPTGPVAAKAQSMAAGGTAMVYLTDPATADADRKQVVELLKATDGVADVYEPARYSEIHLPDPAKNRQAPDLVVTAKDGYAFDNYATGEDVVIDAIPNRHKLGHHGYLAADPRMNAVFIAAGRGVKAGQKLGVLDNIDVAPTIAKLLGLDLPGADGKVITELLSEQK